VARDLLGRVISFLAISAVDACSSLPAARDSIHTCGEVLALTLLLVVGACVVSCQDACLSRKVECTRIVARWYAFPLAYPLRTKIGLGQSIRRDAFPVLAVGSVVHAVVIAIADPPRPQRRAEIRSSHLSATVLGHATLSFSLSSLELAVLVGAETSLVWELLTGVHRRDGLLAAHLLAVWPTVGISVRSLSLYRARRARVCGTRNLCPRTVTWPVRPVGVDRPAEVCSVQAERANAFLSLEVVAVKSPDVTIPALSSPGCVGSVLEQEQAAATIALLKVSISIQVAAVPVLGFAHFGVHWVQFVPMAHHWLAFTAVALTVPGAVYAVRPSDLRLAPLAIKRGAESLVLTTCGVTVAHAILVTVPAISPLTISLASVRVTIGLRLAAGFPAIIHARTWGVPGGSILLLHVSWAPLVPAVERHTRAVTRPRHPAGVDGETVQVSVEAVLANTLIRFGMVAVKLPDAGIVLAHSAPRRVWPILQQE